MATARIEALTDGVYAIAMTLLVLNLGVPEVPHRSADLVAALSQMQDLFIDYIISFLLLAVFLTVHHRHFHVIRQTDARLLWINFFTLLFVVLIPFSTELFGAYRDVAAAAIFFELNIFAIGALKYLQWAYVTHNHRLVDRNLHPEKIALGRRINLVAPVVSLAAIGLAFFVPDQSTIVFITIPIFITWLRRRAPVSSTCA
jgi:uncharacterized membrane protein